MEQTYLLGAISTKDETGGLVTQQLLFRSSVDQSQTEHVLVVIDPKSQQAISATKMYKTAVEAKDSSWNNLKAAGYYAIIQSCLAAVAKCKLLKNGKAPKASKTQVTSSVSVAGITLNYTGSTRSYNFDISKPQTKQNPIAITISGTDGTYISLNLVTDANQINAFNASLASIPWVTTREQKNTLEDVTTTLSEEEELMRRHVKTMDEVALSKDTSWLKTKKYYVIDNEETAEQIIAALESYDGLISYDVETTGLNMNMYCEIGSPLMKQLEEYNASVPREQRIKADRLTGFSFCVRPHEAYYFPCFHRKFGNLYTDLNNETTRRTVENIKSRYTIGDLRDKDNYMAQFIRKTPVEEWGSDVILMERCRDIFEKHKILAHHGSFEYKVNLCYGQDLNLTEDTMILHQLAFKWKNVRTHSGEPSNLKYLTKSLLGIDQLSLEDFFSDFKEAEQAGEVRSVSATSKKKKKKAKATIDFSYMGKEETRCYAPADVDFTLQLWYRFKSDAQREFPDLEYLYGVEIILACAVGYAEFYGLHINEKKIDKAKYESLVTMAKKEHEIRVMNNLCSDEEYAAYDRLISIYESTAPHDVLQTALDELRAIIEAEGNLNLGAPGQVAELLYTKYGWAPDADGKKSMGKRVIKQYEKLKDDEGKPLYPEVLLYRDWKDNSTLITKFFDKLQDFMYPGGNIFTSFGQIACATGRMSSKKPNFQQMPGSITKIIEPRDGYVFFDGDFSQIEYRCLCAMAHQENLIASFQNPDTDYHQLMASLMFDVPYALVPDNLRKQSKALNFGIPYGMGFASLAIQLFGNKSKAAVDEAKEKYELYFKEQPKVRQFFVDVKEQARYNEYTKTYFGRRRYFKFTDENGNISEKFIAQGLRQAGNAVIQGTARDVFGIAAARAFQAIRNNGLLGKVRMCNFIHDEILYEIAANLNVLAVVGMILECMQLVIPGFPPLYVGGGIGNAWKTAKGSMNEIHPTLGLRIIEEAHAGLNPSEFDGTAESVYKYFENRVYSFRQEKIATYVADCEKTLRTGGKIDAIEPAIGKLLGLQFEGGVEEKINAEIDAYKHRCAEHLREPDNKKLQEYEAKIVPLRLKQFMVDFTDVLKEALTSIGFELTEEFSIDKLLIMDYLNELTGISYEEEEEYVAYDDDVEEEEDFFDYDFEYIDESKSDLFGISVIDIAKQFGMAIIPSRGICAVYIGDKSQKQIQSLANCFEAHECDPDEDGAMEVQFVRKDNYVLRPGVFVSGLTSDAVMEHLQTAV